MKLLVDAGNARVKWAWLTDGNLHDAGNLALGGQSPGAVLAAMQASGLKPAEIWLASVAAPPVTSALCQALAQLYAVPVRIAESEDSAAGIRNGYVDPRQLGVDRWLAMIAAFDRFRTAVCVVDAGTAVTVDLLAADGRHLGGFIVPGPALMRRSLHRDTGGIEAAAGRSIDGSAQSGQWGRDTETCIRLGAHVAISCLIENCVKTLTRVRGPGVLVLTGGDAPSLMTFLAVPVEHRPLLVLEGLAIRFGRPSA